MMKRIAYVEFNDESFSWNDGLFIVMEEDESTYDLCKLSKWGKPNAFDDGRFILNSYIKGNDWMTITYTNLKYDDERL